MSAAPQHTAATRAREQGVPVGRLLVDRLSKQFGADTVIKECSFVIEPGQLTVVLGPSGCGKSTLASIVAGYEQPSGGTVTVDGQTARGPSRERLLVFQESSLMPWLTVEQNVMFGPRARGVAKREARKQARAALQRVGLDEFAGVYPSQLSGGMQRRAELARALINEPSVLILDEPFRGLDALTRGEMQEYFAELHAARPTTTLFVTTEVDEALLLADRLLLLSGAPAQVREELEVALPRPRHRETTLRDPRARELKAKALAVLQAEAAEALFGAGEVRAVEPMRSAGSTNELGSMEWE